MTSGALLAIALMSTLVAAAVGLERHRAEAAYSRVAVCMDLKEGLSFARRAGIADLDYLKSLAAHGVGWAAVEEDTLASMADSGDVSLATGADFLALGAAGAPAGPAATAAEAPSRISTWHTVVLPRTTEAASVLRANLALRAEGVFTVNTASSAYSEAYVVPLPMNEAKSLNIGIKPSSIALLRAAGMEPVARFANWPGISPKWIDAMVASVAPAQGAGSRSGDHRQLAVFVGTEMMGYPSLVPHTASAFEGAGLAYGDIEFSPQAGGAALIKALDFDIVRVHSISRAEVDKGLSITTMVDRYVRAAKERNIRLMYIRPINKQVDSRPLTELNDDFVSDLTSALRGAGFTLDYPGSLPPVSVGLIATLMLVLGIAAAGLIILNTISVTPAPIAAGLMAVAAAGFAGMWAMGHQVMARQLAALGAAVIFPSLSAFVMLKPIGAGNGVARRRGWWVTPALGRLFAASACSLAGGLILAACITTPAFMVKANQFVGVKLMHIVPFAALLLAYWHYWLRRPGEGVLKCIARLAATPVLMWHAAAAALAAAVGLVYIVRTGNTSSIAVTPSSIEQAMRALLERVLPARPRTKEFLIGHPAFVAAVAFIAADARPVVLAASALAMIGQVSAVNTFAHLHTPILLTVVRVITGLAFGSLIGVAAAAFAVWAYRALQGMLGHAR